MNIKKIRSLVLALVLTLTTFSACTKEPEATPANLTVNTEAITMNVGDTTTLDYSVDPEDAIVTFKDYDNNIVVVDASGKVVALAEGETVVTIDVNGVTGAVPITVNGVEILVPVIKVETAEVDVKVGDTYTLDISFENVGDFGIAYESDNEDVATVDENGVVTAVSGGTAAITVTVGEVTDTVALTVVEIEDEPIPEASAPVSQTSSIPDNSTAASSTPSTPASSSSAPVQNKPISSSSVPAASQPSSGSNGVAGALVGYKVTVNDQTTLATTSSVNGSHTIYTFYSSSGKTLGSIANDDFIKIKINAQDNGVLPSGGYDATNWFTEQFNLYRGLGSGNVGSGSNSNSGASNSSPIKTIDTVAYANEIVRMVNEKRVEAGLNELVIDSELTALACERAEEVSVLTGHTRPDGTTVGDILGTWGENCTYERSSPKAAFDSWWNSSGHKDNMLKEKFETTGVGCYQAENGKLYWVQIFSK